MGIVRYGWVVLALFACNDQQFLGVGVSPDAPRPCCDARTDSAPDATLDAAPDGADSGACAVHLVAPMSTSTVTQREPTLRWQLAPGMTAPVVDLCADRACTQPLAVTAPLLDDHTAHPTGLLPSGWVYWRVRARNGTTTCTSPTWQFSVTHRLAFGPNFPDSSGGSVFDVNGDGYADLLVGAGDGSAAYVYLGNPTGTNLARIDLVNPDGAPTSSCNGGGTCFGGTLANVGDLDGDGFSDFAVASWVAATTAIGTVHIYFGGPTPSPSDWNGATPPKRIDLPSQASSFGSIAAVGDVNGDGYADFINIAQQTGGSAGLYFGSPTPTAARWSGTAPDRIVLVTPDASFSNYLSFGPAAGVGDVNGDGYADFLIGAGSYNSSVQFGFAHLYYGSATAGTATWNGPGATARVDLITQDSSYAWGGSFGASVSGAGDVNGDGYSDFLIGAPKAGYGAAHLYYGSAMRTAAEWNDLQNYRTDLVPPTGDNYYGWAVKSAGDVNGDGYADFVVGAANDFNAMNQGAAHLYLGNDSASPAASRIDLVSPDGPGGWFGMTLAVGGDVNGDGFADFLVGAQRANSNAGTCHLDFGSASPDATHWNGTAASSRVDLANPGAGGFGGAID